METQPDDDRDLPDEIDRPEEGGSTEFGEHHEEAQKDEWAEDAREGGE